MAYTLISLLALSTLLSLVAVYNWLAWKRKHRLLARQTETLKKADRLNKEVFAIISHDFKEPLIGFRLLLERLRSGGTALPQQSFEVMQSQLDQSALNLKNLTEWAAAELDCCKGEKVQNALPLFNRVEGIIANFRRLAAEKRIRFANGIPADIRWDIDVCLLRLSLRNLLANAVKFSPEGSTVQVRWASGALEVSDRGRGLTEKLQQQLFRQRVKPAYGTRKENGFGIGLYLTGQLLHKNGFRISAENRDGGGAAFRIAKLTA